MAKKRRGRPPGSVNTAAKGVPETVGAALGTVMAKVDAWMRQREELAGELRTVADKLMAGENPFHTRITTPSMVKSEVAAANAPVSATGRRPRTMSAKARKAISEAQKARWAKQKAGARKLKKGE